MQKPEEKIALVCDWLTTPGGAEKVLLTLHHLYPTAPIYTSQYSRKGINWFDDADVRTGWLQIFPKSLRKFLGPLRQLYFSHLDLSAYDLVISVTGAEAKSVRTRPQATHLCYCHVPTQYYWQMYDQYVKNPGFGLLNPLVRFFFKLFVKPLREADFRAAQQPNQFITISDYAREQIRKYYHRDAAIIAPPVDLGKFSILDANSSTANTKFSTQNPPQTPSFPHKIHRKHQVFHKFSTSFPQPEPDFSTDKTNYYVISCRQVTWKRVDLAIKACQITGSPLKVIGDGPEHQALVRLASNSPNIEFIPWLDATTLAHLLQNAKAYLFPSLEPFGIAAVEALAAGCPVIAYHAGGSRDFIQEGKNGTFFAEQTPESLAAALRHFETLHFNRTNVAKSAQKFSPDHFCRQIRRLVAESTASHYKKESHS